MDDTIIYATAQSESLLSITNIHGARRAGRRRRKACMGWNWAAACGVQGRGIIIARLPAQLVSAASEDFARYNSYLQNLMLSATSV